MLILTAGGAAAVGAARKAAAGWPGPCVLVAPPGHGLRQRELRALEADWIVFEWLSDPPSGASLVSGIVTRLNYFLEAAAWPLLYAAHPVAPEDVTAGCERGAARPRTVEADLRDGRIARLLVGEASMAHPLAPEFFAFFASREAGDERFVRLLGAALGEAGA